MVSWEMKFLLDTHTWVWWNGSPQLLSRKVRRILEQPRNYEELLLSAISPWELAKLLEKERIRLSCEGDVWIKEALAVSGLRLVELLPEIAYQSTILPKPFHDDPADQIIVATARHENAIVITKDRLIRNYPHVRSIW